MAAAYISVIAAALPLVALVSLQNDRTLAVVTSLVVGGLILLLGLYLTIDLARNQGRLARSATRLAFYEDALKKEAEFAARVSDSRRRWLRR
ncbi:hypothetical protein B0G38_002553 [Arthrobacter sp. VKM Ac-2550]|nr:hypothetical protein [Arthrobacter sp. VKM Ac-2550]